LFCYDADLLLDPAGMRRVGDYSFRVVHYVSGYRAGSDRGVARIVEPVYAVGDG
jgi:hypothetical protein